MAALLVLEDDRTRIRIAPDLGGGIASADARLGKDPVPILRPWAGPDAGPFGLGSNVLVPFSNRIAGGGFVFEGRFHALAPNVQGEALPLHGDGFQKSWNVASASRDRVELVLPDGAIGPYRYRAGLTYRLAGGVLQTVLTITNAGPNLPFGGGFHPWFPRRPDTRLRFSARTVWTEDRQHLPVDEVPLSQVPAWDFSNPRRLPPDWINNAFCGWDGSADIEQPSLGIEVAIRADPPLATAVVYSPDAQAPFFCFEPVSHAVDAVNRPGCPGMVALDRGETLSLSMTMGWRARPEGVELGG